MFKNSKQKFLLVTTHISNLTKVWACHGFSQVGNALPPVDLASIAAVIKKCGSEATILDLRHYKSPLQILSNTFKDTSYDYFITNVNTASVLYDYDMVKIVPKEVLKIAFGTHAVVLPDELLNNGFDAILIGDPEVGVQNIVNGASPDDAPGIITRQKRNKQAVYIQDIDSLPFPLLELLDINRYRLNFLRSCPSTYILSNRGCPFPCNFCTIHFMHGKKFRERTAENISIEIINNYKKFGIKDFYFVDATFNSSKQRVLDVCEAIRKSGVDVRWGANMRVSPFDSDIAGAMKNAGCAVLFFGVEDTERLDQINKKVIREDVINSFHIAKEHGLLTHMLWMLFPDGDTSASNYRRRVLNVAEEINPDYFQCSIAMPLPGTQMYEEMKTRNVNKRWNGYNIGTIGTLPYKSSIDLVRLKNQIYTFYYFRHPLKLMKLFCDIPFVLICKTLLKQVKLF